MNREGIKVLVIDDDIDFREYVADLLESRGFVVFNAGNGKEGIDILKNESIAILLTDMIMPEHEGVETIMTVKSV